MKPILKKYEVIIQAGGRGSRLRHYTWNKPKCLISYNGKPIVYHLFDYLINSNFHIIGDYQVNIIKKYFQISPPLIKYKIYNTKYKGTCAGIKDVLSNIKNKKEILLIWSDLIINNLPKFQKQHSIITTSSFVCRWSILNKKIIEKPSIKSGIPGIFYFKEKKYIEKVPISGEFVKWYSKTFKFFNQIQLNFLSELGDFSTIENSYNKIGYGRYFNKITFKNDMVIKKCIDKNYYHLIKKEQNWYSEVSKLNYKNIPKIYSNDPFIIEKINGKHLFEIEDLDEKKMSKIVDNIFFSLDNLHNKLIAPSVYKDIEEIYVNKTINRLNLVSKIIPNFSSKETLTINGLKCKNYLHKKNTHIFKELAKKLYNKEFNSIHGDPTLSNIIIKKNLKPFFIDPRGYFANETNILGDKYYDYSKIYYSLIGNYDLFNKRKFKLYIDSHSIEIMMDNIYPRNMENIFKSHFKTKLINIEIIHSLIWLSLSGYVKDDVDSILASFYNGIYWMNKALR